MSDAGWRNQYVTGTIHTAYDRRNLSELSGTIRGNMNAGNGMDMTFLARIREQVVPVTIAVVILAIGIFTLFKMPPLGTIGDVLAWIMLLAAFCVLFSFFPAIAILCGWYTGNRMGGFLAGALPFPLLWIVMYFLIRSGNMVFIRVPDTLVFIAILSAVCGLAGYCAAFKTRPALAVSILLTGVWLFFWMSAFN
jgi:hypothetical protein